MIKKKSTTPTKIVLDLTGPDGNAFVIMRTAQDLSRQLGYNTEAILADMQSGDYEHLIEVMEKHFGRFIIMYR